MFSTHKLEAHCLETQDGDTTHICHVSWLNCILELCGFKLALGAQSVSPLVYLTRGQATKSNCMCSTNVMHVRCAEAPP